MRATIALGVALGGCGFRVAPAADDTAAMIDAPPPAPPRQICASPEPGVVACYDFDGDTNDASPNHLDLSANNLTFVPSLAGMATQFAADSTTDTNDTDAFDVSALTIELWIQPARLPLLPEHAVIMDVNAQYALHLQPDGRISCVLVGASALAIPLDAPLSARVIIGEWTHVACTYDGTNGAIYINGAPATTGMIGGPLHTSGSDGMSVGGENPPKDGDRSRFIGLIDEFRLMSVARSAADICQDAGKSPCP
ncbi:MAG TPA: LamG domain-containing protein [Kofleriaceae bacterium]|nr:LamG domain-containing protein [Kofleriaceae bacterium]